MQNAEKREQCYTARDAFFQCVFSQGSDSCKNEHALYSEKCPKSWKDFFDRQHERQIVLEGQAEIARTRKGDIIPIKK
jgi:hypothetical protein